MDDGWKIVEGDTVTIDGVTGRVSKVTEPEHSWEPVTVEMVVEELGGE